MDTRRCHLVGAETARIGWLIRLTMDMFVFLPLQKRNLGRRMMKNGPLAERSTFEVRAGMKMVMHLQPENHQKKTLETASDPCSRPFQTRPKIPFPKKPAENSVLGWIKVHDLTDKSLAGRRSKK